MMDKIKKMLYNIFTDMGLGFGLFVIGGVNAIEFVTENLGWFMLVPALIAVVGIAMMYAGYKKYKSS